MTVTGWDWNLRSCLRSRPNKVASTFVFVELLRFSLSIGQVLQHIIYTRRIKGISADYVATTAQYCILCIT